MQTYNQFNKGRSIMPLLMNFTTPSPIQETGFSMPSMGYNDDTQISYDMRLVCTRCARLRPRTKRGPSAMGSPWQSDMKNDNDDTKNVR